MSKVAEGVVGEWAIPDAPAQYIGEFAVTRPTPSQAENDLLGGDQQLITSPKRWDLAPIDPASFDPTEPPGRPTQPPGNISPPMITGTPVTGSVLTSTTGTWTGNPTYARQWLRGGANRPASTGTTVTLTAADETFMISCRVTATNADGAVPAVSNELGPVTPTASDPGDDSNDGETVQPTRPSRKR